MFEREHHRRIATVLEALDATLLDANACFFGGGTAISLGHGEYRESVDVDLLTSSGDGFRALRERLSGLHGVGALTRPGAVLVQSREVRADQYGIRTLVEVRGVQIKLEIVREARVVFERPAHPDRICGVTTLTPLDLATTKLLANSDRWADDSAHSRDLIDLAMLRLGRPLLARAIAKARAAYGAGIETDLAKAIGALKRRPGRLDACMRALQMTPAPPEVVRVPLARLWSDIKRLAPPPR